MNIKKLCINKNKSLKQVMKQIDETGYGIAFIVNISNHLQGLVTDSDIRRALLKGLSLETKVNEVMNKKPLTIKESQLKQKNFSVENIPLYGMTQVPVLNKKGQIVDVVLLSKKEFIGNLLNGKSLTKKVKKVLVVGGAGYLGSILCEKLLKKNYKVRVLDNLTYGNEGIKHIYHHPNFEFYYGDICDLKILVESIKDIDAVIHLAAIVGDPASDLNPEKTIESNYLASKMLAEVCKYSQVNRFIFASTCSVYGASKTDKILYETSPLNPVSLYARMKLKSEEAILSMEDDNFSPTVFRMGTLFGLSYRMRFDLVVNTMTIKALKEGQFKVYGGNQWRALCSVDDAADAYIKCLETSVKEVKGQIFNIVSSNFRIKRIGQFINHSIPQAKMIVEEDKVDIRNYCVSSNKAKNILNFKIKETILHSIEDIKYAVNKNKFDDYENPKYSNIEYLRQ